MLKLIGLIPLFPLVGVVINGLFGRRMPRKFVTTLACLVVLVSFVLAAGAVYELSQLPQDARHFELSFGSWISIGSLSVDWGFALDPLSAVLLLVVTGVGFLIHVYSVGYMSHEADFSRFFIYINLFMAAMLTLVLADNLLVMFVGWEGVGLCSYLLIGFYYDKPFDERSGLSCADAGRKAFITNRIGDFFFMLGMLLLVWRFGTLNFTELNGAIGHGAEPALLTGIAILLFLGACGKSAQIPLFVWLPDAMAGPTPVSALIHAATMVTAGVYMVCRMSVLYSAVPEAAAIVAVVGMATAIFAGVMGLTATDIKKVLAYSTVSQLGYMFAAAGVGAYGAAMFHLMTHAFFKALLFLGAGSVIHGMHGIQDITKMGGLKHLMPRTRITFLIGTAAISGFPFLSGFFSKDEILVGAFANHSYWVYGVLLFAAGVTTFYMVRLYTLVFSGKFRGTAEQKKAVHESPVSMTIPLMVLAVLSIAGGWIGIPKFIGEAIAGRDINFLHSWLAPSLTLPHGAHDTHLPVSTELMMMGAAVAIFFIAMFWARSVYAQPFRTADSLKRAFGIFYTTARNLFWVDELYNFVVIRPFYWLSRFFAGIDRWVVDGLVNLVGIGAGIFGQILKLFQTGIVRNYALLVLIGVVAILAFVTR